MAKSNNGGVFAFVEGSVGSVTFSTSTYNSRGIRRQIARQKVTKVKNPNTTAQILQRMKVAPAQRFYNAINNVDYTLLLEHSWESKKYGNTGRLEFMKRALKENGPYIPKGATRFLPAEYEISDGSLAAPLVTRDAQGRVELYANPQGETAYFKDYLAAAASGDGSAQVTILSVRLTSDGRYVPEIERYIPDQLDNTWPADSALELSTTQVLLKSNYVALAVIISKQDASGAWLRSPSKMVLNAALYASLYSPVAMQEAVNSFLAGGGNSLGSEWYLNLATLQQYSGELRISQPAEWENAIPAAIVLGLQTNGGSTVLYNVMTVTGQESSHAIIVQNNVLTIDSAITGATIASEIAPDGIQKWLPGYATQMGLTMSQALIDAIANGDEEPRP